MSNLQDVPLADPEILPVDGSDVCAKRATARATATATATATANATQEQQTAKRQRTSNRRKSSEWPMTTKLAVKHTKITSNGQKVNKIKRRTRGDSQDAAAAARSTCCQHSVRGSGNCCRCACCSNSNIIPQPVRNEKMINELPHYLAKINVLRIFCGPRTRSEGPNLSQVGHVAVAAVVVVCRIINRS